jgi:outer membrane protein OmpA-like peptidoglycan-associated protein
MHGPQSVRRLLFRVLLVAVMPVSLQSPRVQPMITEVVRTGSLIVPGVRFEADAEAPTADSERALDDLRVMLVQHEEWNFEVQVHTGDGGTPERDAALSTARATAVVSWLTRHGIAASRLVPRGLGSTRPPGDAVNGDDSPVHNRIELRKLNEE